MKREKAKQKAVNAIRTIVQAAKELAEAETEYCKSKFQIRKKEGKQNGKSNNHSNTKHGGPIE